MEEIYGIEEFKANFKKVIEEIDSIIKGAYQEKEAMEKLRKLFSEDQIKRLEELMDAMRKRTKDAEDRALVALQEAERYKNELEKEKTRLEKLWDAYKKQEEELMEREREIEELQEALKEKDKEIEELKKHVEGME